jgi:hypothetical protein
MPPRHWLAGIATAFALLAVESTAAFGCDHCGQVCPCQKTCRLVCETKKVEITCWGCKCEDFCIPGPSKPGCKHCEWVCEECDAACDPKGVHTQAKKFVWTEWVPGCATMHTRKKLMKKTITKTIPSYKWVVEDLCPKCQAHAQSAAVPVGTELPQPPMATGAAILPVSFVEGEVRSQITDDEVGVQPAAFNMPVPKSPVSKPAATPPVATKSWQDSFKLPWKR